MDNYAVAIGDDTFKPIEAGDSQEARYKAAALFKKKHNLACPLTPIAELAKAQLLKDAPKSEYTTKQVLTILRKKGG